MKSSTGVGVIADNSHKRYFFTFLDEERSRDPQISHLTVSTERYGLDDLASRVNGIKKEFKEFVVFFKLIHQHRHAFSDKRIIISIQRISGRFIAETYFSVKSNYENTV